MTQSDEELERAANAAWEETNVAPYHIEKRNYLAGMRYGFKLGYRARAAEEAQQSARALGSGPPVVLGMVEVRDNLTGEKLYRLATDEERAADLERRKQATANDVECYQAGWRAREERYAEQAKEAAELVEKVDAALAAVAFKRNETPRASLNKLAAMLGVKR